MEIAKSVLTWAAFAVFNSLTISEGYERMERAYVEAYRVYRPRVPRFLPLPRP